MSETESRAWTAPDGTFWRFRHDVRAWVSPRAEGPTVRLTVRDFRRAWPDAPDYDAHPDGTPLIGTRTCRTCGRRLFAHCEHHTVPCCPGKCPGTDWLDRLFPAPLPATQIGEGERLCWRCQQVKPVGDVQVIDARGPDDVTWCKQCIAEASTP